jgi:hypothetical protein
MFVTGDGVAVRDVQPAGAGGTDVMPMPFSRTPEEMTLAAVEATIADSARLVRAERSVLRTGPDEVAGLGCGVLVHPGLAFDVAERLRHARASAGSNVQSSCSYC